MSIKIVLLAVVATVSCFSIPWVGSFGESASLEPYTDINTDIDTDIDFDPDPDIDIDLSAALDAALDTALAPPDDSSLLLFSDPSCLSSSLFGPLPCPVLSDTDRRRLALALSVCQWRASLVAVPEPCTQPSALPQCLRAVHADRRLWTSYATYYATAGRACADHGPESFLRASARLHADTARLQHRLAKALHDLSRDAAAAARAAQTQMDSAVAAARSFLEQEIAALVRRAAQDAGAAAAAGVDTSVAAAVAAAESRVDVLASRFVAEAGEWKRAAARDATAAHAWLLEGVVELGGAVAGAAAAAGELEAEVRGTAATAGALRKVHEELGVAVAERVRDLESMEQKVSASVWQLEEAVGNATERLGVLSVSKMWSVLSVSKMFSVPNVFSVFSSTQFLTLAPLLFSVVVTLFKPLLFTFWFCAARVVAAVFWTARRVVHARRGAVYLVYLICFVCLIALFSVSPTNAPTANFSIGPRQVNHHSCDPNVSTNSLHFPFDTTILESSATYSFHETEYIMDTEEGVSKVWVSVLVTLVLSLVYMVRSPSSSPSSSTPSPSPSSNPSPSPSPPPSPIPSPVQRALDMPWSLPPLDRDCYIYYDYADDDDLGARLDRLEGRTDALPRQPSSPDLDETGLVRGPVPYTVKVKYVGKSS